MLYKADTYEELKREITKPGFVLIPWCGNNECEDHIKDTFGVKSRCIPRDNPDTDKPCIICNKKGKYNLYIGKQY